MAQARSTGTTGVIVGAGVLIKAVRLITAIFAAVLALHVALVVFDVSPDNSIADNVADLADKTNLGIDDVFTPKDLKTRVLLNHGLAAVIWLLVSAVITKVIASVVRAVA
jgi:hypothetical protein